MAAESRRTPRDYIALNLAQTSAAADYCAHRGLLHSGCERCAVDVRNGQGSTVGMTDYEEEQGEELEALEAIFQDEFVPDGVSLCLSH